MRKHPDVHWCNRNVVENSADTAEAKNWVKRGSHYGWVSWRERWRLSQSVNDCKKYGQQFIILGNGDQGSQKPHI
jgi:hypothetical protein